MSAPSWPEWEHVLSAAAHLQAVLPGTTLVGGTAAAVYARHWISYNTNHVLVDLRDRFDEVLAHLESVPGLANSQGEAACADPRQSRWHRDRGSPTHSRATAGASVVDVAGVRLVIPTEAEMLRIKAVLILRRNATRDYLDFAALSDRLGPGSRLRGAGRSRPLLSSAERGIGTAATPDPVGPSNPVQTSTRRTWPSIVSSMRGGMTGQRVSHVCAAVAADTFRRTLIAGGPRGSPRSARGPPFCSPHSSR